MESQGQIAVSNVCRAVVRAVEKLDEEWSPATLDVMIFHSNQLYRLLLVYCGDTHVLEEVGRSLTLLSEIEESMEETGPTGYVAQLEPRTNGSGMVLNGTWYQSLSERLLRPPSEWYGPPQHLACTVGYCERS